MQGRRRAIRRTWKEQAAGHVLRYEVLVPLPLALLGTAGLSRLLQLVVAGPEPVVAAQLVLLQLQVVVLPLATPPEAGVAVELVVQEIGQGGIASPTRRTVGGCPPVWQLDAQPPALVGIGRKAVAVAGARGTLTDVHPAGGHVVLRIEALVALAEQRRHA